MKLTFWQKYYLTVPLPLNILFYIFSFIPKDEETRDAFFWVGVVVSILILHGLIFIAPQLDK